MWVISYRLRTSSRTLKNHIRRENKPDGQNNVCSTHRVDRCELIDSHSAHCQTEEADAG